jgi:hypothetical protein
MPVINEKQFNSDLPTSNLSRRKSSYALDWLVTTGVLVIQFAAFFWLYPQHRLESGPYFHEYGNIAQALLAEKGYGNVFGPESGPTAWTLPGFVYMIAFFYKLFETDAQTLFWAFLTMEYALTALTAFLLLQLLKLTPHSRYRYWVIPLFLGNMAVDQTHFLNDFNDLQCMVFIVTLALYCLTSFFQQGKWVILPSVAFILPLFNPAVALAFAVVLMGGILIRFYKLLSADPANRTRPLLASPVAGRLAKVYALVILGFGLSTGLWAFHTYQSFGRFIPSKSNLWYEFYQSNVYDQDGILSESTMTLHHPNSGRIAKSEKDVYTRLGEAEYLLLYKQRSEAFLKNWPEVYWQKFKNRLSWAFIWSFRSAEDYDHHPPTTGFSPSDSLKLVQAKLINSRATSTSNGRWINLSAEEPAFLASIKPLHLEQEAALLKDWREAKHYLLWLDWRPRGILRGVLYSLIPSLIILAGLLSRTWRRDPVFLILVAFYLVYLLPYVTVAYYFRYQLALTGLYTILFFYLLPPLFGKVKLFRGGAMFACSTLLLLWKTVN